MKVELLTLSFANDGYRNTARNSQFQHHKYVRNFCRKPAHLSAPIHTGSASSPLYSYVITVVPEYSPWVSGLVEGMNKILLERLKRLCAPDLGEDEYDA